MMKARQLSRRQFIALSSSVVVAACAEEQLVSPPGGATAGGAGGQGGDGLGPVASSSSSQAAGGAPPNGAGGQGGTGGEGGQGGAEPGPDNGEPPSPWDAPGLVDESAYAWGVQTGDAAATSVLVSLRTTQPEVSLTVVRGSSQGWQPLSSGQVFVPQDGLVHLELSNLEPDVTYALAFYSKGAMRRSRVARFRSALAPATSRVIRFGATSCFGDVKDPWPSVTHSVKDKLDFFLLLGDSIYADDQPNKFNYVQKYKTALSLDGLQDLTAGTSIVATWDDHEIDDNWSWSTPGIQARYDEALGAFRDHLPQRLGVLPDTLWRKLSWGDALDVFVLDCRGERLGGKYISVEQMDWLKSELLASSAVFKVIMTSVPIFDFTGTIISGVSQDDRWQGYPTQRYEILDHIRDESISGVLWVSGDVHFGAVGQVDPDGGPGDDQWEVIVGPAGSFINPAAFLLSGKRLPVVETLWNWARFEADPATGKVLVEFVGDSGSVLSSYSLQLV